MNAIATDHLKGNGSTGVGAPAHQTVYQTIRENILFGEYKPGRAITLQGIADSLQVSLTPIRESVRRLVAERALEVHDNRRISVPAMTAARLEELYLVRLSLETELAFRAVAHVTKSKIIELEQIDADLDRAIEDGDVYNYLRCNYRFHRELYQMKSSEILFPIVETLWLQLGPSLRVVCGRYGTSGLSDQHKSALDALRSGDGDGVRKAIERDILQGKRIIEDELLL